MFMKCLLSFAAGGIFGIMLLGIILCRVPEPPKNEDPEVRMISVSKIPGAADLKAVTFCIDGKKMAAIYTTSILQQIGECERMNHPELPTPIIKTEPEKERKSK